MVTDSFSPLVLPSPPLSTPAANDSNMHSCRLTGRAFERRRRRGSCKAEAIVPMRCSRRAITGLNTTGTAQPSCALRLLQPNQEEIVFEVLVTKPPIVLGEVKGLTPTGADEYITSPSVSALVAMGANICSGEASPNAWIQSHPSIYDLFYLL